LVGVTKYVEPEIARMLFEAGVTELGESRPQELWHKAEALADLNVRWHAIGHLQRNKVRRTLECSPLIHSVDSLRLLEEINRESAGRGKVVDALLEVNVSGDAAKHGLLMGDVESLFPAITKLDHIQVRGLMTMSGLESGPDQTRREFAALRELAERLKPKCSDNISMTELSMGMSEDFEIAIEEGATMVRIGSALFEGVKD
jgi:pyridoxal phosphate enzyme (YggS family)